MLRSDHPIEVPKLVSCDITSSRKRLKGSPLVHPLRRCWMLPLRTTTTRGQPWEQHALFLVGWLVVVGGGSGAVKGVRVGVGVWVVVGSRRPGGAVGRQALVVAHRRQARRRRRWGSGRAGAGGFVGWDLGIGNWDSYIIERRRHGAFHRHRAFTHAFA